MPMTCNCTRIQFNNRGVVAMANSGPDSNKYGHLIAGWQECLLAFSAVTHHIVFLHPCAPPPFQPFFQIPILHHILKTSAPRCEIHHLWQSDRRSRFDPGRDGEGPRGSQEPTKGGDKDARSHHAREPVGRQAVAGADLSRCYSLMGSWPASTGEGAPSMLLHRFDTVVEQLQANALLVASA